MKLNEHTALISSKILLVPYEQHHVHTYSVWMDDEEIREATASERLTLEEEHEMQQKWRLDVDKLTFISCLPPARDILLSGDCVPQQDDAPERMVGDVNLFLYEGDGEEEGERDNTETGTQEQVVIGEVELMIAAKEHQGKGLGRASLLLFLHYVLEHQVEIMGYRSGASPPVLAALRVKIHQSNMQSIKLFESVGFVKRSEEPSYFGEFELVMRDMSLGYVEDLMRLFGIGQWREFRY